MITEDITFQLFLQISKYRAYYRTSAVIQGLAVIAVSIKHHCVCAACITSFCHLAVAPRLLRHGTDRRTDRGIATAAGGIVLGSVYSGFFATACSLIVECCLQTYQHRIGSMDAGLRDVITRLAA